MDYKNEFEIFYNFLYLFFEVFPIEEIFTTK